jgi:putative transposase
VNHWTKRAEQPARRILGWLGLGTSKFHDWKHRYGKSNEHNARIPRDWWLQDWEKEAIIGYLDRHPLEGYRRLTFMMLDEDVVAVSPATVYRVLKQASRLDRRSFSPSKKGTGFVQSLRAHEHWHVDVSYIEISGTFYYLTSLFDGYSRFIVHWEIRESMTEGDVETIVQRALERHPNEKPGVKSDKGSQFIARDFKEFIRVAGITRVRTSPHHAQSQDKLEHRPGSLDVECARPAAPSSLEEAQARISSYVAHYNTRRLHSTLGYITPADKLAGLEPGIFAERDRKLEEARERRATARRGARVVA